MREALVVSVGLVASAGTEFGAEFLCLCADGYSVCSYDGADSLNSGH